MPMVQESAGIITITKTSSYDKSLCLLSLLILENFGFVLLSKELEHSLNLVSEMELSSNISISLK